LKRDKSAGNQNFSAGVFPFIFQEIADDDFCQTDCFLSNPSGQLVEECDKNNISKPHHDPTVYATDMTIGVLLSPPNSALLSLAEFSLLSLLCFWTGGFFYCFKDIFYLNYNFIPHFMLLCICFIFHVNYQVYFYLNL
jgi:hypothetical protein